MQAELELKNEAEVRNAGAALRGGVISHSASMLAGEDEDAAIEGVGIGGGRGRGARGGGRGRGGGGQGGRASPATPRPVSVASVAATFAAPGTPGALSAKKPRKSRHDDAKSLVSQVVNGVVIPPAAGMPNQDLLGPGDSVSVAGGSGTQVGVTFGAATAVSVDLQERSFVSLMQQILAGSQLGRELRKASLQ